MAKMYIHNCKFLNIKPLFSALASEIKKKKTLAIIACSAKRKGDWSSYQRRDTHLPTPKLYLYVVSS